MIAYFDCFSGISGDMTLGAFFDLGVPPDWLSNALKEMLGLEFELSVTTASRMGISGRQVMVRSADQPVRHYSDIQAMIQAGRLPTAVQTLSLEIFDCLAAAEARIHNCAKADVHFHEVGAVDSLVDIVGAALCVDYLKIERVIASKIPLSRGTVSCAHGILPVPAPATLQILQDVPVYGIDMAGELVTPTGAAIIRILAQEFGAAPDMTLAGTGYGVGSREFESLPNLLRVVLGRNPAGPERLLMVETCIDDMNPELYSFLIERLMADGALDVWLVPAFMKKNRPGTLLQLMCPHSCREVLIQRILTETTTLGVRYYEIHRRILDRQIVSVDTIYGAIPAKQVRLPDGRIRIVPEYEACKTVAADHHIPLREVYDLVCRQAGQ